MLETICLPITRETVCKWTGLTVKCVYTRYFAGCHLIKNCTITQSLLLSFLVPKTFAQYRTLSWPWSYPGHGLWCAVTGRGGYRAPRAAGSARRPLGEAAPDRKTTSLSLLSECSNPPLAVRRPKQYRGWGGRAGGKVGEAGCQISWVHHFL